jgi:TP901 family phage tail tape measure protein
MSFSVKYIYDLVDNISPKLKGISGEASSMSRNISKSVKNVDNSFKNSKKSTNELVSGVKDLAKAYLGFEVVKQSIQIIANFDKAMSSVKAVTGATAEQMQILRDQAIDLGAKTQFSARDAAEAMSELGKAGLDVNKIYQSMPAILDLAAAGGLELKEASSIAANIMAGFQIPATEMVRIADTLSYAANAAQTSVQEIGLAVSYVGQTAKQANIPLEQVSSAIGILSNMGIQGERAGTGLRRVLSELSSPTRQAMQELSKYGITYSQINPQTNKFSDILKRLQPISKNMSSTFKIFGDVGSGVFQVLSENVDQVDNLTTSLNNAKGSAAATAAVMRDNLAGDIDNLASSVEGLILTTGDSGLGSILRSTIQLATDLIGALSGNEEAFNNLSTPVQLIIVLVRALADGLSFVFDLLLKVAGFVDKLFGGSGGGDFKAKIKEAFMLQKEFKINGSNNINSNMALQNNVAVEVGFKNAPSGTTAKVSQPKPVALNLGRMGQFSEAY